MKLSPNLKYQTEDATLWSVKEDYQIETRLNKMRKGVYENNLHGE